jgi:hypothetical protein
MVILEKASLLFVVGQSRKLTPDFELALADIDLTRLSALRALVPPETPYKHRSEVVAVIEVAARSIESGDRIGISGLRIPRGLPRQQT